MLKLSSICVCICCIYYYLKTRLTALLSQDRSPVVFTSGWLPSGPDEVVIVLSNCGLYGAAMRWTRDYILESIGQL
jgi:hypothetical protein